MAEHKIAVLSDTHGLIRPEVKKELGGCELILHGGDISSEDILDELQSMAPVQAVRGNNDGSWAEEIPYTRVAKVFGLNVFMCHKKSDIPEQLPPCDLVVFGHSHKYEVFEKNGVTWLNPGSCGPRRFHQEITMAVLTVEDGTKEFRIRKVSVSQGIDSGRLLGAAPTERDLDRLVSRIIKEMEAGKSLESIASKHYVDRELVESICRMYSTHPGVTVGGIIDRMELRKLYR